MLELKKIPYATRILAIFVFAFLIVGLNYLIPAISATPNLIRPIPINDSDNTPLPQSEPQEAPQTSQENDKQETVTTHFVAIGDTGSGVSFQTDIAKQLEMLQKENGFQTLLLLGDIIYPYGDWPKDGERLFTQVYQPLMDAGVNMRVVLGNHDVAHGYIEGTTEFYKMPGRYYRFSEPNIDFFAIDTNLMNDTEQLAWLDTELGKSTAPWKIVFAHHPIYSSGVHLSNKTLQQKLEPLLIQHQVDLYLAGHDHDYERFKAINGVNHIVSGGGGAYLRDFKTPEKHSLVRKKAHHFMSFSVTATAMAIQAIDKTGTVIDNVTYTKSAEQN